MEEESYLQVQPARLARRVKAWHVALVFAVGALLVAWLLLTPPGLLGKTDAIGYAVCHQIDGRSFHLGERPVSLCARCSGMYLGALVGLVFQWILGRRRIGLPPKRVWVVLGFFLLAFAVDGLNSYLTLFIGKPPLYLDAPLLYPPHNLMRLLTGTGMGLAMAAALYPSFNLTVWQRVDHRLALPGLRHLAGMTLLALAVDGLVLTENPLLLYPLTILSAATTLLVLSLVYTMVWVILVRKENTFDSIRAMGMVLLAGFGTALLQIALIDLARYWLTGTWEGFHIFLG
jgi:uncharacterized membrane protein